MQDDLRFSEAISETDLPKTRLSAQTEGLSPETKTIKNNRSRVLVIVLSTVAILSLTAIAIYFIPKISGGAIVAPETSSTPTPTATAVRDPLAELSTVVHDTKAKIEEIGVIETATYRDGSTTVTVFDPNFKPVGTIIQQSPYGNWDLTDQSGELRSGLALAFFTYIDADYSPTVVWKKTKRTPDGKLSVPVQWADANPTFIFTTTDGLVSSIKIKVPGGSLYPAQVSYEYGTTDAGMKILKKGGQSRTEDFD
jgi:hypothetical protein